MVKNSLFSKMVIAYTIIITVSFTILAAFLSFWFQDYIIKNRKEQLSTQLAFMENLANDYLESEIPYEELDTFIKLISTYIGDDIILTDRNGYVYAVSSVKYKPLIGKQVIIEDYDENKRFKKFGYTGKDSINFDENSYIMVETIKNKAGKDEGAVLINISMTNVDRSLSNVYQIIWISAVLAVVSSCIVIYYFSQKLIINPLSQMSSVARKIAAGDVDKRVTIKSDDEIEEFAEAFNVMADSLQKVEHNRKEFISNVSHELRSPITSIKGFIGGILDGVIPEEKHSYYLKVAYEEIQRLTRLINDLLDLSAVDSGNYKLNKKALDVNELIRICILRNEARIKDKDLSVEVFFEEDELYVLADEDKIMQVVTNLLDNAIKYANTEGTITISCKPKGKKAYIEIFNEGPTIAEEDITHIWDRFYKGDKSRTQKFSTGLGLSIVKKILTLHDEEVWVKNKDNGVIFTFTLTVTKRIQS